MRGHASSIELLPVRTYLAADAAQDSSSVLVTDGTALAVAEEAVIGGATYTVENVEFTAPDEPDVLVLASSLAAAVEAGEPVGILPLAEHVVASVDLDGAGSVNATVRQDLQAQVAMQAGVYEGDDRPIVEVEVIAGEHVIVHIEGAGAIAGSQVVGPLPNAELPEPPSSDGLAPASSPTPVTVPALRQVFVKWDAVANEDLVTYEVHVTDVPGAPAPVAGDTATLFTRTPATLASVPRLADGSPLAYDTDYFFALVATDPDGAATASPWVTGRMDRAGAGDLVAGAVTTETLNAVLSIVGMLKIGGDLIELSPPTSAPDGNGGQTLMGGIVIKDPSNPAGEPLVRLHPLGCTFKGRLTADIVTVLYDLVINGNARLSGGSALTMSNGVPDPLTGPAWQIGPRAAQAWPAPPAGYSRRGATWDGARGRWLELLKNTSNSRAYFRTVSTAGVPGTLALLGPSQDGNGLNLVEYGGLAVYDDQIYLTAASSGNHVLIKCGLDGSYIARNPQGAFQSKPQPGGIVAHPGGAGIMFQFGWEVFHLPNPSSLYNPTDVYALDGAYDEFVSTSLFVGVADLGSEVDVLHRIVCLKPTGVAEVYQWPDYADVVQDPAKSWTMPNQERGYLFWDGANFLSLPAGGTALAKWSGYYPDGDGVWSAVYADKTSGGSTKASPPSTATVGARQYVTLTLGELPPGATGSDVWVGYAASGNAPTKYLRAEALTGRSLALTGKVTTGSTTIPTASTAGGAPAVVKSEASDGWVGSGNGEFSVRTPTADGHAANKAYVDEATASAGEDWAEREEIPQYLTFGSSDRMLRIRRSGKMREVTGWVTGSISTSGSQDIASGIPEADRPMTNTFAFCYMGGGYAGSAFSRPNGTIAINNMSGATRSGTHQFTIYYTVA